MIDILKTLLSYESRATQREILKRAIEYIENQDDIIKTFEAFNESLKTNNEQLNAEIIRLNTIIIKYVDDEIEELCA